MHDDFDFRQLSLNTTFSSPLLYALANSAAKRCNDQGDFDTITAIILAYTSLECFLNEIYQAAKTTIAETKGELTECDSVRKIGEILDPGKENKRTTLAKFDCAWLLITGARIDKNANYRKNLRILESIRNGLIHSKSETTKIGMVPDVKPKGFEGTYLGKIVEMHEIPAFMNDLFGLKLIPKPCPESKWVLQVCSERVAQWACESVRIAAFSMIDQADESFPLKSILKTQSLAFYSTAGLTR